MTLYHLFYERNSQMAHMHVRTKQLIYLILSNFLKQSSVLLHFKDKLFSVHLLPKSIQKYWKLRA